MKTVEVYVAQPARDDQPIMPATISITKTQTDPLPLSVFDLDARAIVDTLWAALPGATLDRVMADMFRRYVGQLRVPRRNTEEA